MIDSVGRWFLRYSSGLLVCFLLVAMIIQVVQGGSFANHVGSQGVARWLHDISGIPTLILIFPKSTRTLFLLFLYNFCLYEEQEVAPFEQNDQDIEKKK